MNILSLYGYQFFIGTVITLSSWLIAGIASLVTGLLLGIIGSKHFSYCITYKFVKLYTFIAKGIPAYVQILIAYFVLPSVLGINLSAFFAASLALAFCSSGYVTEIIRAGINTVHIGQWEACLVLGYSFSASLRRIILPQAMKNILPALIGEFEQLLKSTSLLATIGVTELTRTGINVISRELDPLPVYFFIACVYLCLSGLLQIIMLISQRYQVYDKS
ncbi:amino acid ABC transporter permease [Candidatus Dependentiae bacterium]|nr:amino acid ABC transporter permease [Candidatus Dependentiae bacterium]